MGAKIRQEGGFSISSWGSNDDQLPGYVGMERVNQSLPIDFGLIKRWGCDRVA
jgi:hypothetical protein